MTDEEYYRRGKFSEEYQRELASCYAFIVVLAIACLLVCGVAKAVMYIMGA